jgi:threonine dehydrogenase-like Zn-dependent dehydrogenase
MKVVIAHRSGEPRVVDLPESQGGRNFITVRVSHCAARLPDELEQIDLAPELLPEGEDGRPLGSCASGTVLAVGDSVTTIKTGIRVAVTGRPFVYHAGHLIVPEHLAVELPKKVNQEEGAWAGLGAEVLHLFRSSGIQLGEVAMVFGADMPGFVMAQVVKAAGAVPILIDESEFRTKKAGTLGLVHAAAPDLREMVRLVDATTEGRGLDAAFVMRPDDVDSFAFAAQLLREGGTLVLGESISRPVSLDSVVEKGVRIITTAGPSGSGVVGDAENRWSHRSNMACFCELLADRKVQITPLVNERTPIERAPTAYEKARRNRDNALGVVFTT